MFEYHGKMHTKVLHAQESADALRRKFDAGAPVDELARDAEQLASLCESLMDLPGIAENNRQTSLTRHVNFLRMYLSRGDINSCRQDIVDITDRDLPAIAEGLREWWDDSLAYDKELRRQTGTLLKTGEFDSAIRKAFVILSDRLRMLGGDEVVDLDGPDLVNRLFGKVPVVKGVSERERVYLRDLLAGMYGLLRNHYAHRNVNPQAYEVEAVLSMTNLVLQRLDRCTGP